MLVVVGTLQGSVSEFGEQMAAMLWSQDAFLYQSVKYLEHVAVIDPGQVSARLAP